MKILNIDAFTLSTRQISLGGKTYAVEEPSLQEYIDTLKASESLEAESDGKVNLAESFEGAVKAICKAIPTMPVEVVKALKLPAMTAVLQFIRGEIDGEGEAPVEGEVEKKPS
jgi:hypothetical protein